MAKRSLDSFPTLETKKPLSTDMDGSLERDVESAVSSKVGDKDHFVENSMNLSLLDPSKFGWAALGGVGEILPPHQVRILCLSVSNSHTALECPSTLEEICRFVDTTETTLRFETRSIGRCVGENHIDLGELWVLGSQ